MQRNKFTQIAILLLAVLVTTLHVAESKDLSETSQIPHHRFLTSSSEFRDYWVSFSDDGKLLLFSRAPLDRWVWELRLIPHNGGASRPIVQSSLPVSATRTNWSVSNQMIAFTGVTDQDADVWLIKPDGSTPRAISLEGLSNSTYYPSWYPDGKRLAVVDFEGDIGRIKRINLEARTVEVLTDPKDILAGMPSVSPKGDSIAFAGQRNNGSYDQTKNNIWLLDNKGVLKHLDTQQGRAPSWSPDGEWIVFESNRESQDGQYAVFIIHRTGGIARRLTHYELNANHPVFSPDGKFLAFSARVPGSNKAWGIAIIDVPKL
ncbi:MAG: hypothetical protein Q9M92_08690 [Enterobacterales bacterium]|nr:hypothetical protein [Enterobacterales bacterium]